MFPTNQDTWWRALEGGGGRSCLGSPLFNVQDLAKGTMLILATLDGIKGSDGRDSPNRRMDEGDRGGSQPEVGGKEEGGRLCWRS